MGEEYPVREPFFANKYARLLFRCCVANEIGPEACYMLVQIAHTEDAGHYRKAVTFFNEQLAAVCGFRDVRALDRARTRAVETGWLNYQKGGKGKAGRYFVTIPKHADGLPDNSVEHDFPGVSDNINVETNGIYPPDKRQTNARQTPEKCAQGVDHSSLSLIPIPPPSKCGAGSWKQSEKDSAVEQLKKLGLARAVEVVKAAEKKGMTPAEMEDVIREFEDNSGKFKSTGAISDRIRYGKWPADGIRTAREAISAKATKQRRQAEKQDESIAYRIIKDGQAQGVDDSEITRMVRAAVPKLIAERCGR